MDQRRLDSLGFYRFCRGFHRVGFEPISKYSDDSLYDNGACLSADRTRKKKNRSHPLPRAAPGLRGPLLSPVMLLVTSPV